jgi:WD40 repeat protein
MSRMLHLARRAGPTVLALFGVTALLVGLAFITSLPNTSELASGKRDEPLTPVYGIDVPADGGPPVLATLTGVVLDPICGTGDEISAPPPCSAVADVRLSTSGDVVFFATMDGDVWSARRTEREVTCFVPKEPGTALARIDLSSDGRLLATGSSSAIRIFRIDDAAEVWRAESERGLIDAFAFAPDARMVIVRDVSGDISISTPADTRLREVVRGRGAWEAGGCCAYSPDGSMFCVGSPDGRVRVYRIKNWELGWTASLDGQGVSAIRFAADGLSMVCGTRTGDLVLLRTADGRVVVRVAAHRAKVSDLCFTRDGLRLYSTSHDGTLKAWSLELSELPFL